MKYLGLVPKGMTAVVPFLSGQNRTGANTSGVPQYRAIEPEAPRFPSPVPGAPTRSRCPFSLLPGTCTGSEKSIFLEGLLLTAQPYRELAEVTGKRKLKSSLGTVRHLLFGEVPVCLTKQGNSINNIHTPQSGGGRGGWSAMGHLVLRL